MFNLILKYFDVNFFKKIVILGFSFNIIKYAVKKKTSKYPFSTFLFD